MLKNFGDDLMGTFAGVPEPFPRRDRRSWADLRGLFYPVRSDERCDRIFNTIN